MTLAHSNTPTKPPPILGPPSNLISSNHILPDNNDTGDTNDPISTSFGASPTSQSWSSLKQEILEEYENTACIKSPISATEGKHFSYPSPHQLNSAGFGQPSLNHCFSVQGCLKNTIFFIIKDKWLPSAFTDAIHPDFKRLRELIDSSSTIDFSPLLYGSFVRTMHHNWKYRQNESTCSMLLSSTST